MESVKLEQNKMCVDQLLLNEFFFLYTDFINNTIDEFVLPVDRIQGGLFIVLDIIPELLKLKYALFTLS